MHVFIKAKNDGNIATLDHLTLGRNGSWGEDIHFNVVSPEFDRWYKTTIAQSVLQGKKESWYAALQDVEHRRYELKFDLHGDTTPAEVDILYPTQGQRICGQMLPFYDILRPGVNFDVRIKEPEGWLYETSVEYVNPSQPKNGPEFYSYPSHDDESYLRSKGSILVNRFDGLNYQNSSPVERYSGHSGTISRLFDFTGEARLNIVVSNWAGMQTCKSVDFYVDSSVDVDRPTINKHLFSPLLDALIVSGSVHEEVSLKTTVYGTKLVGDGPSQKRVPDYERPVRHFLQDIEVGNFDFEWDGDNDSGEMLADGFYAIEFVFTDSCGLTETFSATGFEVELDATPPDVHLHYPNAGDDLSMLVGVMGSAADKNFHAWAVDYAVGAAPEEYDWVQLASGDREVVQEQLMVWNMALLPPGDYSLRLRAIDKPGNEAKVSTVVNRADLQWLLEFAELDPKLFSPNGDGKFDIAQLRFGLQGDVVVTVLVEGNNIAPALLLDQVRLPAGTHVLDWNGLDGNGLVAPDGMYQVVLRMSSAFTAGQMQEEHLQLELDNTVPQLAFGLAEGAFVKGESPLVLMVKDAHLESFQLTGVQHGVEIPIYEGNASIINGTVGDLLDFAEGELELRLSAKDRVANEAALSVKVKIDNTPPELALSEPVDASFHGGLTERTIVAHVKDEHLKHWSLSFGKNSDDAPDVLYEGDEWPAPSSMTWLPANYADGHYKFQLTAQDHAGWQSSTSVSMVVDNTPPIALISSPIQNALLIDGTEVMGTATDANFAEYLLELAPGEKETATRWTRISSGQTAVDDGNLGSLPSLPDGLYTLKLTVFDKAGNSAESVVEVHCATENTAEIILTGNIENGQHVRLNWALTGLTDMVGYHVEMNGVRLTTDAIADTTYLVSNPGGGMLTFVVYGTTLYGRILQSNAVVLTVEATALQAVISSPRNGSVVSGNVDIVGSAYSGKDEFKEYTLMVAPGADPSPADYERIGQSFIGVQNGILGRWNTAGLPEGSSHSILLSAWDIAGRAQHAKVSLTVDNLPPAKPTGLVATPVGNDVTLTWNPNTEADLAGYLLYRDGELVNAPEQTDAPMTSFILRETRYEDLGVPDGDYLYTVQAMDLAGNLSELSDPAGVMLDNRAPKAIIISPATQSRVNAKTELIATVEDKDVATVRFEYMAENAATWVPLGGPLSVEPYKVNWDSTSLPYGAYLFRAVATDHSNNTDAEPESIRLIYTETLERKVTAKVNGGSVFIEWTPSAIPKVAVYRVAPVDGWSGITRTVAAAESSVTLNDFEDQEYTYQVESLDANGAVVDATLVTNFVVHTPILQQPYTPISASVTPLLSGSGRRGHFAALMNTSSEGETDIGVSELSAQGVFEFVDVPLSKGRNDLRVVLEDADGNRSKPATVHVVVGDAPAQPQNLQAEATGATVSLRWDSNTEADLWGYAVLVDGKLLEQNLEHVEFSANGLYEYRLGHEAYVTHAIARIEDGQHELVLNAWDGIAWIPVAKAVVRAGAYEFRLSVPYKTARLRLTDSDGGTVYHWTPALDVTHVPIVTEARWSGRLANGEVPLSVLAVNQLGLASIEAEPARIVVDGGVIVPAVLDLAVSTPSEPNALVLRWSQPADQDAVMVGYRVYRSQVSGEAFARIAEVGLGTMEYLDHGLTGGARYYYVVRSIDALGNESVSSNEASGVPHDAFEKPALFYPAQPGTPFQTDKAMINIHGMAAPGASVELRRDAERMGESEALTQPGILDVHADLAQVSWSPDGRYALAYSVSRIKLYSRVGERFDLIRAESFGIDSEIAWSPDSTHLAYVDANKIAFYRVSDGDISHISISGQSNIQYLAWNGKHGLTFSAGAHIYAIKAAGDQPEVLVPSIYAISPSWSPDGSKLMYWSGYFDASYGGWLRLVLFDLESSTSTSIHDGGYSTFPKSVWTQDGKALWFTAGAGDLHEYRLSDGNARAVASNVIQLHALPFINTVVYESEGGFHSGSLGYSNVSHWSEIPADAYGHAVLAGGQIAYMRKTTDGWTHSLMMPPGWFLFQNMPLMEGDNPFAAYASINEDTQMSEPVHIHRLAARLADLAVGAEHIVVIPGIPQIGETVRVSVRVFNNGGVSSQPVNAVIGARRPDATMQNIVQVCVPAIQAGGSTTLNVDWSPEMEGKHQIVVSIDPENTLPESDKANNVAWRDTTVLSPGQSIQLGVQLDKDAYQRTDTVHAELTLVNGGASLAGTVGLVVEDEQGYTVSILPDIQVARIGAGETAVLYASWNSGNTLPGSYRLRAEFRNPASQTLVQASARFALTAESGTASARIVADRVNYTRLNSVYLTGIVDFADFGNEAAQVPISISVLDAGANILFTETRSYTPRDRVTMNVVWEFANLPIGAYGARITVGDVPRLAEAETTFGLIDVDRVQFTGNLAVSADRVLLGDLFTAEAVIENTGTQPLEKLPVRIIVAETHSGRLVDQAVFELSVPPGDSVRAFAPFDTANWLLRSHTVSLEVDESGMKGGLKAYRVLQRRTVSIFETEPPLAAILSPLDQSFVPGMPQLRVSASDRLSEVSLVEYRVGDVGAWYSMELDPNAAGTYVALLGSLNDDSYKVNARATDTFGNMSAVDSVTFTLDTLAPIIVVQGVVNGERYTTAAPEVSVTDLHLHTTQIKLNGEDFVPGGQISQEGSYTLEVQASDKAGNTSAVSVSFFIGSSGGALDEQPPVVAITRPAPGSFLRSGGTLEANVVDEQSAVAEVLYQIGTGPWNAMQATVAPALFVATLDGLPDASYTASVRASDTQGNWSAPQSVDFVVDSTPPQIEISGVEDNQEYFVEVTPVVRFTDLYLDGTELRLNGIPYVSGTAIQDVGTYVLYARATDKAGNGSLLTLRFELLAADIEAPIVTILQPADQATMQESPELVINAIDRESAVKLVEYRVDGGAWQVATQQSDPEMFEAQLADLAPGAHIVEARATDLADNQSQPVSVRFTIVSDAVPDLSIQEPVDGSYTKAPGSLVVQVMRNGNTDIARVEFCVPGTGCRAMALSGASPDLFEASLAGLAEGSHVVAARLIDTTEQILRERSVTVHVDLTAPEVKVIHPVLNSYLNTGQLAMVIEASDSLSGVAAVEYRMPQGVWITMLQYADDSFQGQLEMLSDGLHTIQIRARDKVGNDSAPVEHAFTVDTIPPEIEILGVADQQRFEPSAGTLTPSIRVFDENLESQSVALNGKPYVEGSAIALVVGNYSLVVEASDKAGNYARKEVRLTVGAAQEAAYPIPLFGDKKLAWFIGLLAMWWVVTRRYGKGGNRKC